MGRERLSYGFTCGTFTIPAGSSNSLYVMPAANEIFCRLKYGAGGSLEIMGASTGATGIATAGTGYLFSTTESVELWGSARYFLMATGATTTAFFIKGLSQGS